MKEWKGEPFATGSRFLVIGEWGFGDAFLNLRYFGLLKEMGADITYISWKRQRSLFARHPWVDRTHGYVKPGGDEPPTKLHTSDYDYFTCIMDLPSRFDNTPSSVPNSQGYINFDFPSSSRRPPSAGLGSAGRLRNRRTRIASAPTAIPISPRLPRSTPNGTRCNAAIISRG